MSARCFACVRDEPHSGRGAYGHVGSRHTDGHEEDLGRVSVSRRRPRRLPRRPTTTPRRRRERRQRRNHRRARRSTVINQSQPYIAYNITRCSGERPEPRRGGLIRPPSGGLAHTAHTQSHTRYVASRERRRQLEYTHTAMSDPYVQLPRKRSARRGVGRCQSPATKPHDGGVARTWKEEIDTTYGTVLSGEGRSVLAYSLRRRRRKWGISHLFKTTRRRERINYS